MGKYLDILRARRGYEINERHERSPDLIRFNRLFRTSSALAEALSELERHRPAFVAPTCWQRAVADGRRFLAQWGEQAEAFGWSPTDLFGLHDPPAQPHPSYRRL